MVTLSSRINDLGHFLLADRVRLSHLSPRVRPTQLAGQAADPRHGVGRQERARGGNSQLGRNDILLSGTTAYNKNTPDPNAGQLLLRL